MTLVSCAIAMGSNLGPSAQILAGAIAALENHPQIHGVITSPIYRTAPVGPPQPDYLNQCVRFATDIAPEALLAVLLGIEAQFGRVRRERWGARHLDLDLLLYGDRQITQPGLQVPHPRMHERVFVLVPLVAIAPDWVHPELGCTIAELRQQVATVGVVPYAPSPEPLPPSAGTATAR